ncbi:hypothetical protein CVT26_012342 [Gymnopilus dilepis]|uniref:Uncharacterized protein n=1 Tax=Gymnopilus dilepis TaxID=231916 RepID=A0A409YQ31_9AGAR|nr:hypothetical protein CVT26_012342 [Gymnopilus dilepis]
MASVSESLGKIPLAVRSSWDQSWDKSWPTVKLLLGSGSGMSGPSGQEKPRTPVEFRTAGPITPVDGRASRLEEDGCDTTTVIDLTGDGGCIWDGRDSAGKQRGNIVVVGEIDLTSEDENVRSGERGGNEPHSSLHNLGVVEPNRTVHGSDNDGEEGLKGTVKVANNAAGAGDDELEMMEVEYLVDNGNVDILRQAPVAPTDMVCDKRTIMIRE